MPEFACYLAVPVGALLGFPNPIGAAFGVLIGRAVYLQGLNNDFLQRKGASRYGRVIELPATRGMINKVSYLLKCEG